MDHRGRRYGKVRENYLVGSMSVLDSRYSSVNTQEIVDLKRRSKKDLEARAKNS